MIGQDKRIVALREISEDDNEYSGWVRLAQSALNLIAERDALLQEAYENPEVASTSAWLLRAAELVVPEMQSARKGYVMGLIEHPESLSSRIAGLSESLECGDGGVRGDFRAALAEVDALAEQLRGAAATLDAADSVARMLAEALRAIGTDDEQTREALTMFDLYDAKRGR